MLVYDLALRLISPLAPRQQHSAHEGAVGADARSIEARLWAAERALPDDPDAAALLLDGVLAAVAALWLSHAQQSNALVRGARRALPLQPIQPALADHSNAHFGLRLRLALRAPNVEARLAHCRDLLRLIDDENEDDEGDSSHVR